MSHIQSEPIAGTVRAGSTLMVASGPDIHLESDAERHLAAGEVAKLSGAYVSEANPVTVGEYRPARATRVASLISKHITAPRSVPCG
jgi:hypothetical protein